MIQRNSYGVTPYTPAEIDKLKTFMRQGYVRLVSALDALPAGDLKSRLTGQVKDLGEAINNWLNTDPLATDNIDLWTNEGNRINAEAAGIIDQISGGSGSTGIAVAAVVVLGLALWASRS
jgi:hypothetical protein